MLQKNQIGHMWILFFVVLFYETPLHLSWKNKMPQRNMVWLGHLTSQYSRLGSWSGQLLGAEVWTLAPHRMPHKGAVHFSFLGWPRVWVVLSLHLLPLTLLRMLSSVMSPMLSETHSPKAGTGWQDQVWMARSCQPSPSHIKITS